MKGAPTKRDPKLQSATESIKEILRKHDLCGVVVLASETKMEFDMHLEPKWSLIELISKDGKNSMRFNFDSEAYPSKEVAKQALANAVGNISSFVDVVKYTGEQLEHLLQGLAFHVHTEHVLVNETDPGTKATWE